MSSVEVLPAEKSPGLHPRPREELQVQSGEFLWWCLETACQLYLSICLSICLLAVSPLFLIHFHFFFVFLFDFVYF